MLFAFGIACADDGKKDQERLQGTWKVTEFVMNGKPMSEDERKGITIIFSGDTMTLMTLTGSPHNIGKRDYKFKLDPTKKPSAIETIPQDGPFRGKTGPAIYELRGDTLKLCIPNKETTERPKKFEAPEGSNLGLFVLKRLRGAP
jgi:uncharacterized protein (TIGR03067 family)